MARRDDDDDFGDDFPPSRKSNNGLLIPLAIGGLGLLALLLVGVAVAFFRTRVAAVQAENIRADEVAARREAVDRPAARPMTKLLTQKEFESMVMNKSREQIIASVGRPDDITTEAPNSKAKGVSLSAYWYFKERVLNEATGKPYPTARVYLSKTEAYRIDYP